MSLPPLLKHIYNYGTEEVIRRGKKIFYAAGVQLLEVDHVMEQVRFRVRNDLYHNYYTVTISRYLDEKKLSVRCQCPYNLSDICRHEVAALYQLNEFLHTGFFERSQAIYNQAHTVLRMRQVNREMLRMYSSEEVLSHAERWVQEGRIALGKEAGNIVEARVEAPDGLIFPVILRQNEERFFDTSCSCGEQNVPLCVHKASVFLYLFKTKGVRYFQGMQNWDEQKNKLLALYGYSLTDDLTGKFAFSYDNGKPFLRVLDSSIKRVSTAVKSKVLEEVAVSEPEPVEEYKYKYKERVGVLWNANSQVYPFCDLQVVSGIPDDEQEHFSGEIAVLPLTRPVHPASFPHTDIELIAAVRKCSPDEVNRYIEKAYPFGNGFIRPDSRQNTPDEPVRGLVWEYLLPKYQRLLQQFADHPYCFILEKGKELSSENLLPVAFSPKKLFPQVQIFPMGDAIRIALEWRLDKASIAFEEVRPLHAGVLLYDHHLYAIAGTEEMQFAGLFPQEGFITVSRQEWPAFLEHTVMQWPKQIAVEFDHSLEMASQAVMPEYRLFLKEKDQTLILEPAFSYSGIPVKWQEAGEDILVPEEGKIRRIKRKEEEEEKFVSHLKMLHSDMQLHPEISSLSVPAQAVLSHNWFFRFLDEMKEWRVQLFGFEHLKKLRINKNQPVTRLMVDSGMDWFDTTLEVSFGEQKVSVPDLKRALSEKQHYVRLDDGTMGMLPEEWLKKYTLLFKIGETKNGKLRLKKYHFSVIDQLMEERDEALILEELETKKHLLANTLHQDFSTLQPPQELQANLRPYQLAGYRWLAFLEASRWGGILADDMGLGKTVQTLAWLLHYKNTYRDVRFLVVCPTTLMYNWENEIKKFTPTLTYHIHHGPKRNMSVSQFSAADIIITTYGTMRSDIRMLQGHTFDYIVLDESQAIKNPQSQAAKAALLLSGKHRLALSGTPVQNNTFDLYAQMNFLNPGILGSREFFMNEFATPIDKFQEADIKKQLRQLTYPFMLRRTKEQVAKDLPEKTETILYCEMGREQRTIYEAYRNNYRSQILDMIDERGMDRSRLHILQGLTRLRQICDSPAILNDGVVYENHSVKLDELVREITENIQEHKTLIFSQFLGMLALIRKKLEQLGVAYTYFDGSTSAADREKAIREFQGEDACRVFLISLKAGGIGLNLTAADYVYIVDPWWNPAVEQQAIDRTHRIGQTRNIFAYRLICRNTIEEKMLVLQARKKALAQDLVGEDNTILKRLTREDIEFLFS